MTVAHKTLSTAASGTASAAVTAIIRELGDPILRKPALAVAEERFGSAELGNVVDLMMNTMKAANGAGIAAPQIGISDRIFIVHGSGDNPRYPYKPKIPLTVFINPELTVVPATPPLTSDEDSSGSSVEGESFDEDGMLHLIEGCLSVPGYRGQVVRHPNVIVTARTVEGTSFTVSASGHAAGTMQHELDHLNGRLFPDHSKAGRYGPDALMSWAMYDKHYKEKFEPVAHRIARKYPHAFRVLKREDEEEECR